MTTSNLNFESFELPFFAFDLTPEYPEDDSDEAEDETDEAEIKQLELETFEGQIPDTAIYLGHIEQDIDNMLGSEIDDYYYIIPLDGLQYHWGIFRLFYNDNWGQWEWTGDIRTSLKFTDYKEAAGFMLRELWSRWDIDLEDESNHSYYDLIMGLM